MGLNETTPGPPRSEPTQGGFTSHGPAGFGSAAESFRSWVTRAQIEAGTRGGMTEAQSAKLKDLRKEVPSVARQPR
jgi:hypothetical protein